MEHQQLHKIREAIIELEESISLGSKTPRLLELVKEFRDLNKNIMGGN